MIYRIKNLDMFIKYTLKGVCKLNGYKKKEIKNYIDEQNIKSFLKKYIYRDEKDRLFISEKDTIKLYEDINEWIVGLELASLAGQDLIECYWDNKQNCMMFYNK